MDYLMGGCYTDMPLIIDHGDPKIHTDPKLTPGKQASKQERKKEQMTDTEERERERERGF